MIQNPNKLPPESDKEAWDLPDEMVCPITSDRMKDPVCAEDGHTYERAALREWLSKHGTSPITREPMRMPEAPNRSYDATVRAYERARLEKHYADEAKKEAENRAAKKKKKAKKYKEERDEDRRDRAEMKEMMKEMLARQDRYEEKIDGLITHLHTDRGMAMEYRRHYSSARSTATGKAAVKGMAQGIGAAVGATLGALGLMGLLELVGVSSCSTAVLIGGAVVGGVVIGGVVLAAWEIALIAGAAVAIIGGVGYGIYKAYQAYKGDSIYKSPHKNELEMVVEDLTTGQRLTTLSKAQEVFSKLGFKLNAVGQTLYYVLCEISARIRQLMTRWSADPTETAQTRNMYLVSMYDSSVPPVSETILQNNPELVEIKERIEYVGLNSSFPASNNLNSANYINDNVVQDINTALNSPMSAKDIEGNKVLAKDLTVTPIINAATTMMHGHYNMDYTEILQSAVNLDTGYQAMLDKQKETQQQVYNGKIN